MKLTIEIEPEEAARFVKAFVPNPLGFAEQPGASSFAQHLEAQDSDSLVGPWNDAIRAYSDAMKSCGWGVGSPNTED